MSLFNDNRPRSWTEFEGQEIPITYLRNRVIDGKHPNAIYIHGPSGCGKSSLAFLYAKTSLDPLRAEGDDSITTSAYDKDHPNITYHLVRDSSSTKEALDRLVSISMSKPIAKDGLREDQYRRFIILDEVELIHPTTFSLLLNPLEYSPSTTTWILISMEPDKLPPITREAIESRCKELRLNPLTTEQISCLINREVDNWEVSKFIAKYSGGNARKAWSLVEVLNGADCLSLEGAEQYLLSGIGKDNRIRMWKYFFEGNTSKVVDIISQWPDNRALLGQLLMEDLIPLVGKKDITEILKALQAWVTSRFEYPLEAALLSVISVEETVRPTQMEEDTPASFLDLYNNWIDNVLRNN